MSYGRPRPVMRGCASSGGRTDRGLRARSRRRRAEGFASKRPCGEKPHGRFTFLALQARSPGGPAGVAGGVGGAHRDRHAHRPRGASALRAAAGSSSWSASPARPCSGCRADRRLRGFRRWTCRSRVPIATPHGSSQRTVTRSRRCLSAVLWPLIATFRCGAVVFVPPCGTMKLHGVAAPSWEAGTPPRPGTSRTRVRMRPRRTS